MMESHCALQHRANQERKVMNNQEAWVELMMSPLGQTMTFDEMVRSLQVARDTERDEQEPDQTLIDRYVV